MRPIALPWLNQPRPGFLHIVTPAAEPRSSHLFRSLCQCSEYLVRFFKLGFALCYVLADRFEAVHHLGLLVRRQLNNLPMLRPNLSLFDIEIRFPGIDLGRGLVPVRNRESSAGQWVVRRTISC